MSIAIAVSELEKKVYELEKENGILLKAKEKLEAENSCFKLTIHKLTGVERTDIVAEVQEKGKIKRRRWTLEELLIVFRNLHLSPGYYYHLLCRTERAVGKMANYVKRNRIKSEAELEAAFKRGLFQWPRVKNTKTLRSSR